MVELREMTARHARDGRVEWIGVRPARLEAVRVVEAVEIGAEGLAGDHGRPGKRAVTLVQAEHLGVIGAFLGREAISPNLLRRNLVVSRVNLLALKGRLLRVGSALLEVWSPCPPCSRMEEVLGAGGYSAMRGHGGVYASVVVPGFVEVGDVVWPAG